VVPSKQLPVLAVLLPLVEVEVLVLPVVVDFPVVEVVDFPEVLVLPVVVDFPVVEVVDFPVVEVEVLVLPVVVDFPVVEVVDFPVVVVLVPEDEEDDEVEEYNDWIIVRAVV
jgi:hypothetical protein